MNHIALAQGAYGKFKIKAAGEDFTAEGQVHAFVYNDKGQILKQFSKDNQSGYTALTPVPEENDSVFIEILPADTKNIKPGKYFVDLQKFNEDDYPLHNPSFLDENILFELHPSVAKDKSAA